MAPGRGQPSRGSGPRGARPAARPARRPAPAPGRRPSPSRRPTARAEAGSGAVRSRRQRPRFTGRAAVLVLVVAVLMVSYASSMRAYVEQQDQISSLRAQIAESEAELEALEREKERFDDPAYVKAEARKRFRFVMPGEIGFQVIDEDGEPFGDEDASLTEPPAETAADEPEWWESAWGSVQTAGDPPRPEDVPQPAEQIRPEKKQAR